MDDDQISQLPAFEWMKSRIPKLKALVTFVPGDGSDCPPAVRAVIDRAPSRWFPEQGGHRVQVLYEGGPYDPAVFHVEEGAWDHEHCKLCGDTIEPMTLCYVTKRGRYILLCAKCYAAHVAGKTEHPA
jgi:hypothetical protein